MSRFHNVVAALGGLRLSRFSNQIDLGISRAELEATTLEDEIERIDKGRYEQEFTVQGYSEAQAEVESIEFLRHDGAAVPFTMTWGQRHEWAVITEAVVTSLKWSTEAVAQRRFELRLAAQSRFLLGRTLFSSFRDGLVTEPRVGRKIELGLIAAGQVGALTLHAVLPPGVLGTAPRFEAAFETDVAAEPWSVPVTRATAAPIEEPGGQIVRLDGDQAPVTDPFWALRVSAVAGTDNPTAYLLAAAVVHKPRG